jgi:tetratricopeptide (TPR) repeat protein
MATNDSSENIEEQPEQEPQQGPRKGRVPLTDAQKKRLQKCCDHATKQMEQGQHDYATTLFSQCVQGDPTNLVFAQNFIKNLQKKYGDNKKGQPLAALAERGARGAQKKAVDKKEWDEAVKNGVAVLKVNPWDVPALVGMATAAAAVLLELEGTLGDTELFYLKSAFEASPKNADTCRLVALSLGKRRRFDEAVAFWHKVEQLRPGDDEPQRSIATLLMEKTIKKTDQAKEKAGLIGHSTGGPGKRGQEELSPEEQLKRTIRREPNNLTAYFDLSQIYLNSDRYKDAEEVLAKAVKASNNDPDVWERLEDARLRGLRQLHVAAGKEYRDAETPEAKAEAKAKVKSLLKKIVQKELGVWKSRCDRYPTNLMFKYEVGYRHQMLGDFNEAIKEYQAARNDPRRKGLCLLNLGECFRHIKQYRLAASHYELAIQEIPDRDADNKKMALYRAGRLAYDLKNWEAAEKHLGALAALDYSYKDVSALLDEINQRRAEGEGNPVGGGAERE